MEPFDYYIRGYSYVSTKNVLSKESLAMCFKMCFERETSKFSINFEQLGPIKKGEKT